MFCGKCGAQVSDGAAVCPKCGNQLAAKTQAPKMNQAFQNAGAKTGGATGNSGSNLAAKKIGIIVSAIAAVVVLIFVLKGIFGGGEFDGTYIGPEEAMITFDGNKMTCTVVSNLEFTAKYKVKDEYIIIDPKSIKFTEKAIEYLEDGLGYDKDNIESKLESLQDYMEDRIEFEFEYDEKDKVLTLNDKDYYYAENYEVGPSGEYTYEEDDDISISFKNGKATFNNDGDKETVTYYCYEKGKDVIILFYGEDIYDSDFYDEVHETRAKVEDDEFIINMRVFEKES